MQCRKLLICLSLIFGLTTTVKAAPRFWVSTIASNWSNPANWSASSGGTGGASVPVAGDDVNFDNLGTGNCMVDAAITITSLTMNAGYTGSLIQGANALNISGGATFSGGNFTGGTANITVTGLFTLSGAAFLSTAAILELRDNAAFTSGTFAHNNGTVCFKCSNTTTQAITGASPTFYILEFVGIGRSYTISSTGNITVLNSLNLTGTALYNLNTGTIDVQGDINVTNSASTCGGDAVIAINGGGTQNFTGATTVGKGALPKLVINKTSGVLNLSNYPGVANDFSYSAGTINAGISTVCFTKGTVGSYNITGTVALANILFTTNTSGVIISINAGTILTATSDLTLSGTGNLIINAGNIAVNGNLFLTNTSFASGGTTTITVLGAVNQAIDATAVSGGQCRIPNLVINKTGGVLSFLGDISFYGNATYIAGTIDPGTATIHLTSTLTLTGNFAVYNLSITSSGSIVITIASGTTITVLNDYTMGNGIANNIGINTGTLAVQGNIINVNTATGGGGSATLLINGTGAQSITSTGIIYQGTLPAVTINKPNGTLTLPSLITERSNWTYIAGSVDVTTNNSTVAFGSTLTISGNQTLNHIIFDAGTANTFTIAAGTTVNVSGDLTISGTATVSLNTGTIDLQGNLILTNAATGGGGSATINFAGTNNQAITSTLAMNQSTLPVISINKTGGLLIFPSIITVKGANWTYTSGNLDVTTNNSTIVFANTMAITGSVTLNNVTFDALGGYTYTIAPASTLTIGGTMTMSGSGNITLNTGTINLTGDLVLTNTATGGFGTTVLAFVGTTNQNISSVLPINQCNLPAVTINKSSGILTLPAILTVRGNWTYVAGVIDATTNNSTVVFRSSLAITGSHTLNNVNLAGTFTNTYTINTGTVLTVAGTLITSGVNNVAISTPVAGAVAIQAQGDILITNTSTGSAGTGAILINGTGNQSFASTSAAGQCKLPYIRIQKTSGMLSLSGNISVCRDWTYISGTVNAGTSTVAFGGNAMAINSAGMSFYHVTITGGNNVSLTSSLSVSGNLFIVTGTTLVPGSNSINLTGNWTNYSSAGFAEATSTVNFNGTAPQTISCIGGETFTNATINNTGSYVQLLNNVTIGSTLAMTQGNIDLNTNTLMLGLSVASNGTLAYTAGTIINTGSFTRWLKPLAIAAGSVAGLFPVGTAQDYRPLFVSTTAAPTTGGSMTLSYNNASGSSGVSIADPPTTIVVRNNLSWSITTAGLAGGTYTITVQGTGFGGIGNVADLRLNLAAGIVGTAGTNSGTVTNPQINRTGLSLANLTNSFFLGSIDANSSPLPVKLISFTATKRNAVVELAWATAQEWDTKDVTIQRSSNGNQWDSISSVPASGNTTSIANYRAFDYAPFNGLNYYRLKQNDLQGSFSLSSICAVNFRLQPSFSIYPNPAANYIVIEGSAMGRSSIHLVNQNGQRMPVSIVQPYNASKMMVDLSTIPKGCYFIYWMINGETISKPFMKL